MFIKGEFKRFVALSMNVFGKNALDLQVIFCKGPNDLHVHFQLGNVVFQFVDVKNTLMGNRLGNLLPFKNIINHCYWQKLVNKPITNTGGLFSYIP